MTEPILSYHQTYSVAFSWEQLHQRMFMNLIRDMRSESTLLNFDHIFQDPMT